MQKKVSASLAFLLIAFLFAVSGYAAGGNNINGVKIYKDSVTAKVTVEGYISQGSGEEITVKVFNPEGTIDFIGQTTSGEGGRFVFAFTPHRQLAGEYIVKLGGQNISSLCEIKFRYTAPAQPEYPQNGNGTGSMPGQEQNKPGITVDNDGNVKIIVQPVLENGRKTAITAINREVLQKALREAKADSRGIAKIALEILGVKDAEEYSQELPAEMLTSDKLDKKLEIRTPMGTVTIPGNMLIKKQLEGADKVQVCIGNTNKSRIKEELKKEIGERPVIRLTVMAGGKELSQYRRDAAVSLSVDYKPSKDELREPEYIVVWQIDEAGNRMPVPGGRYDPDSGKVAFATNHSGTYAVAFMKKTFSDTEKYLWAQKQIQVIASKGIIKGVEETKFKPEANITRAEFIDALVKALGLAAEFDLNFSDMDKSSTYYESVGVAKELGITGGTGNNRFSPDALITRQEMSAFVIRALKIVNKVSSKGTYKDLMKYADAGKVSGYAVETMATIVKEGILQGSGKNINPAGKVTRAQTAVVMYNIYNR